MLVLLASFATAGAAEFLFECTPDGMKVPFRALLVLHDGERSATAAGYKEHPPLIEASVTRLDDGYVFECTVSKRRGPAEVAFRSSMKPGDTDSASIETHDQSGGSLLVTYARTTIGTVAH